MGEKTAEKKDSKLTNENETTNEDTPMDLEQKVTQMEATLEELKLNSEEKDNKYRYLYAEFDNFKRRNQKERGELLKFGFETAAKEFLHILDNLERALEHTSTDKQSTALVEGVEMISKQFLEAFKKFGVQAIETKEKDFDPHLHEAVAQEVSNQHPEGTVIKEHQKGYTLHGRLLRPAKVIVSKKEEDKKED